VTVNSLGEAFMEKKKNKLKKKGKQDNELPYLGMVRTLTFELARRGG